MWDCAATVLTARLGCIYTQLLSHVVPRRVAQEAVVAYVLAALVEMKSQSHDSRPGFWRFPMGSAISVHRLACVGQCLHGWL